MNCVFQNSKNWDLVLQPSEKFVVGCQWVFIIKVGFTRTIDRPKSCLVAKGFNKIFGPDYGDTFSLIAKMSFVRLFLLLFNVVPSISWMKKMCSYFHTIFHLNKSLYGLKQCLKAWFERFSIVIQQFGIT